MIAPRLKRFLIAVSLAISIIFYQYVLIVQFEQATGKIVEKKISGAPLKKLPAGKNQRVVAFSLKKKLQIDGKEYNCRHSNSTKRSGKESEQINSLVSEASSGKWMRIQGTQVFVYSVHQDRRLEPYRYLRIIAMVKGGWKWRPLYCQIECSDGQLHTTKITKTPIVAWATTNHSADHAYHNPVLLSCRVPLNLAPTTLHISTQPCQLSPQKFPVNLNENPHNVTPNNFTVCVKPLDFPYDISAKLLQWIAVNKILGADKFDVYVTDASPNVKLDATVTFRNHSRIEYDDDDSFEAKIWQKRRYELLIYNDCLYRNIHASRFVVPVDIDEIIVPRLAENWHRLPQLAGDFASFSVRNAYFFKSDAVNFGNNNKIDGNQSSVKVEEQGEKVDFFESNIRSGISPQGHSGKSFVSTQNALLVSNHHALIALKPGTGLVKHLDLSEAQMNHYKDGCDEVLLPECKQYVSSRDKVVDNVIARFKSRFYVEYLKLIKSL